MVCVVCVCGVCVVCAWCVVCGVCVVSVVTTCFPLQQVDEEVFRQVFIPRTLDEVDTFERDALLVARGQGEDIAYQTVTGMREDLSGPSSTPKLLESKLKDIQVTMTPTPHSITMSVDENVHEKEEEHYCPGSGSEQEVNDELEESGSDDESTGSVSSESSEEEVKGEDVDRKAHKKAVKEANRERRKTKVPKHIKKRKEKLGRQKRGAKGK